MKFLDFLPGKKTNIVAGAVVLAQAASAAGFVDAETLAAGQNVLAALLAFGLAMKAKRSMGENPFK